MLKERKEMSLSSHDSGLFVLGFGAIEINYFGFQFG